MIGVVTSNKMQKSVVVAVSRLVKHTKYGKYVKRTSTFMAHDEEDHCNEGDQVRITPTRPLSRHKRWSVEEILRRAEF